jgi:hypothetical protein
MSFHLKSWCETNRFVYCPYTRRDRKPDGDVVCQQGLISIDDGSLVAIVSAGTDDDELFDIVQALARVSLKRLTLDNGVYLFEYNPAQLDNVAALMRPCRDQPVHYDTVASGAFASRWRVQRRKRRQAKLDAPDHEGLLPV